MKKRTFISFDYDHDHDIKECLVGQARNADSPFEITDMSIKEPISFNWKENARRRIKMCDVVVILCGEHTDTASGVTAELTIAQEEGIPYHRPWERSIPGRTAKTERTLTKLITDGGLRL